MTEKIIYVAIDGKEFEIERDCVDYENSLRMNRLCKSTLFLDAHFNIISADKLVPEEVFYIYVDNEDDKETIDEYFTTFWTSNPFSTPHYQREYSGWFYYDSDGDDWKHFETEVQVFKDMENNFTKIMLDKGIRV